MDPTTVTAITAVTAVSMAIGLLIGHLVSISTTRKQIESSTTIAKLQIAASAQIAESQIHAQVILAERVRWIATLRDSISEFVGAIHDVNRYNANVAVNTLGHGQMPISQAGVLML